MTGIVILNYQAWNMSLRCMKSIVKTTDMQQTKIYLVDNASTVLMPQKVDKYIRKHQIVFLQSWKNGGYSSGNNIGIRRALLDGCGTILITNNDIVFCSHAIEEMAGYLKEHPDTGIAGPMVLDEKKQIQRSCCSKKTEMKEILQVFTAAKFLFQKQFRKYYCLDQNPKEGRDVYYVSGCCFMMSAECAEKITPLDENTVLYNEEMIIGIRMEQCNLKTHYCPAGKVIHRHGYTTEKIKPFTFQCISLSEMYYCSAYLKAPLWQIFLLREYRRFLYFVRSFHDKALWDYRKQYGRAVKKAWRKEKSRHKE